ncbi:HNH endonuclease [Brachybacterium equifaecis]|nr:DUF222 domain-containing protein [Brachybacterium equifaecis]
MEFIDPAFVPEVPGPPAPPAARAPGSGRVAGAPAQAAGAFHADATDATDVGALAALLAHMPSEAGREALALLLGAVERAFTQSRSTAAPVVESAPGSAQEALATLGAFDQLRSALAALEATWQVEAESRIRAADAASGISPGMRGRGVAQEIALARRISPSASALSLGAARRVVESMPATLGNLFEGRLTERQLHVIGQRTDGAEPQICAALDAQLAAEPTVLEGLGPRRAAEVIAEMVHALDPSDSRARAQRAAQRRHVSLTPLADGMARVSAVLPAIDAVSVMSALRAGAESLRARGHEDHPRTIEADLLVSAVLEAATVFSDDTGEQSAGVLDLDEESFAQADEALAAHLAARDFASLPTSRLLSLAQRRRLQRLDVGVVITDRALLGREDDAESAYLVGYGAIPAHIITETLRGRPPGVRRGGGADRIGAASRDAREMPGQGAREESGLGAEDPDACVSAVYRRLYTHPRSGELVAMEATARAFPVGIQRMVRWRDRTCRTPWCNAAVRHLDHAQAHARGGPTSFANASGLCERCNLQKEIGAWEVAIAPVETDPGCGDAAGGGERTVQHWQSPNGAVGTSPTPRMEPRPCARSIGETS